MFRVVRQTKEFERIYKLDRKQVEDYQAQCAYLVTGSMSLRPIQAQALVEARDMDGLFAPIGVGHGKTLICMLLPTIMLSERTVILCPATLKNQFNREIDKFSEHFAIKKGVITVLSYNDLSSSKNSNILEELNPDLVISDEAHKLKRYQSARTKRFLRYMLENPHCRFCALSGTMTAKSITEYTHLIELALRKNSPLPSSFQEMGEWAGAVDVNPREWCAPGALKLLCEDGEGHRDGYRRRLIESHGVVATNSTELPCSLIIQEIPIIVPKEVTSVYDEVMETWEIGDESLTEAIELARVQSQIVSGFYYRYLWPNGVKDHDYINARKEWAAAARDFLRKRAIPGVDSEGLLKQAIREGKYPELAPVLARWNKEYTEKDEPVRETVWLSDFLSENIKKWIDKNRKGIVWYKHRAMETLLHELGIPVYGQGKDASIALEPLIACSIEAQGTGKNLQAYSRNLLLSFPSNGAAVEQLLGRTHRQGQSADEVTVDWFSKLKTDLKAFKSAKEQALYMEETTGQKQKILYATHITKRKKTKK